MNYVCYIYATDASLEKHQHFKKNFQKGYFYKAVIIFWTNNK